MDISMDQEETIYTEYAQWEGDREAAEVYLELREVRVLSTYCVLGFVIGEREQEFIINTPTGYPHHQVPGKN